MRAFAFLLALAAGAAARDTATQAVGLKNQGDVDSVYGVIERVLPDGAKAHFTLAIDASACGSDAGDEWCVRMEDAADGTLKLTGTTAAELTYGIGHYLREYCNMTIGWKRGGGSNLFMPKTWPKVGATVLKKRSVPWSYIMNVCTHSYSLAWYSWSDWEAFIDWMALSGVNLFLAMTGQEEVQYKVFQQFGLNDTEIRTWFNGPAFLTWSRGQNEYGNNIAGPLPRSWMKQQWGMNKQILQRTRSLGISGQLPGFQGNVPVQLKTIHNDANITKQGDTGWFDSLDPLYSKIADVWMKQLIEDFGTDHWYQLDGYFNGGTAPWLAASEVPAAQAESASEPHIGTVPCQFSGPKPKTYLAGMAGTKKDAHATLSDAMTACSATLSCGGITLEDDHSSSPYQLRASSSPQASPGNETSWVVTNDLECHAIEDLPDWFARGKAAYTGLNRTDPDAVWSFQGWAFIGWSSSKQAASLKSFIDATPDGKFNVIDMSTNGEGEWKKWNNASFWGANYVWTTLHDFGGTDGLKGNLDHINRIPFDRPATGVNNVWGTGFTPEGIDQNPVYYDFMLEASWRSEPVTNITDYVVARQHRRYGFAEPNVDVTSAWSNLVQSAYSQDLSVQDGTGVPHLGSNEGWSWKPDMHTPTPIMCNIWSAWTSFISAASAVPDATIEPFRYDLVNTGREVLAQIAGPAGKNFTSALGAVDADKIKSTGDFYVQVLTDLDSLVATDEAFLLGPWIEMAKQFAQGASDCADTGYPTITSCIAFYEWNARVQLTTWNPTPKGGSKIPGGPIDYASKHWSGLIADYYAARVTLLQTQAIKDAASHQRTPSNVQNQILADHAYDFTTATKQYPTAPVGDAVEVSKAMHAKYTSLFETC